jgi:hypothetical protein
MEERYGTSSYTIYTMFLILERRTIPRTIPPSNDTKNDIFARFYSHDVFTPRRPEAPFPSMLRIEYAMPYDGLGSPSVSLLDATSWLSPDYRCRLGLFFMGREGISRRRRRFLMKVFDEGYHEGRRRRMITIPCRYSIPVARMKSIYLL